MSKPPFHYFVLSELMISYLKEHFKGNSLHSQAIFTSMLYIILHTVSPNLSRALYPPYCPRRDGVQIIVIGIVGFASAAVILRLTPHFQHKSNFLK